MIDDILKRIYFDISHPASFGGLFKLYKFAKLIDPKITIKDVKKWLSNQDAYTLYKKAFKNYKRNKIYVSYVNEQWEIDLLDYSNLKNCNKGFKYLVTIIDVFSKYLYVIPIKSKNMIEVTDCFEILFKRITPTKLRSDRGKEFDNSRFRALCQKYNINYFVTENQTKKCAVVERINLTLRNKIERYMFYNKTKRYIHIIKNLVDSYNKSIHRTTGMAPESVNISDEKKIFRKTYKANNMLELLKNNKIKHKFEIDDLVRQKFDPKPLKKGYKKQWTENVYKVRKVFNKFFKPQYSLEREGVRLRRRFYPEELQEVYLT